MKLSENSPNIISFSPDALGKFIHQDVPHAEIPMGSIVCSPETGTYYHKESGSTYRLLVHSATQGGFIKGRLIDESSLPAKFHIVSLPSPDQVTQNISDRLREGQQIDERRVGDMRFVIRDQLKMLHDLGIKGAEGAPEEIFSVGQFGTIPEGSLVVHPRQKILMTKRGSQVESMGLPSSIQTGFVAEISPEAEVQYIPRDSVGA